MLFLRSSKLKLTYVLANGPSPDETRSVYLDLPGIGYPTGVYPAWKGNTAGMDWPKGCGIVPLDYTWGNTLITDGTGSYGVRSWSITAEPGLIPGRLEVGSYKSTNTDASAPDYSDTYTLDAGAWDTGPLRVNTSDGTILFSQPYLRWTPINLVSLL